MNQKEFLDFLKKNVLLKEKMKDGWVEANGLEYTFSPAFGGERINVLVREIGKKQEKYKILFADDIECFM